MLAEVAGSSEVISPGTKQNIAILFNQLNVKQYKERALDAIRCVGLDSPKFTAFKASQSLANPKVIDKESQWEGFPLT